MAPVSQFKLWLENIWSEHCKECEQYHELPKTREEYFRKYKYWLKREFRFQRGSN